jgi:cell wall-associated NlpC family hydrolase
MPTTPHAFDTYALVGTALALRGTPYRNGGSDPNGFDCSGFTQYVFAQYGVALPREVREQYQHGNPVEPSDLAPGDLVFFATTDPGASHVAIVIGGDQFVHAPSSSGAVRVERLRASYWSQRYLGARRMN